MAVILRPGLILLRCFAHLSTQQRQRLPEAVRVEVWQSRRRERRLEDAPDRAVRTLIASRINTESITDLKIPFILISLANGCGCYGRTSF
jgi:hypothetical protein